MFNHQNDLNQLAPVFKIIETIHTYDFVLDGNAKVVYMGTDLIRSLGGINPVGMNFNEIFISDFITDVTCFEELFLSKISKDELKSNYLEGLYRLEAAYSIILNGFVYVNVNVINEFHKSNRIKSELLSSIKDKYSPLDFLMEIMYNLPSDIAIFNSDYQYVYLNPSAVKNDELRDFLIGKTYLEYCVFKGYPTTIVTERNLMFNEVFSKKRTITWEDSFTLPDGSVKVMKRVLTPIVMDSNKVLAVLGLGVDITDVKLAQEQANESEKRYKYLFDNNLAGVFRMNENGELLDINLSFSQIFGFESIEELKNQRIDNLYLNTTDRLDFLNLLKSKGRLKNHLMKIKNKKGETIHLLLNVQFLESDVVGIIEGTLIDVTALTKTTLKLEREKRKLERLAFFLDQTSDGIQVFDEKGSFVYLNKTASERLGISQNEFKNYTIFDIENYFKTKNEWQNHLNDLFTVGKIVVETTHTNVEIKSTTPVEVTAIHREFEGANYVITIGKDINEKIATQELISEKNKYLQLLTDAINSSSLVSVTDMNGSIIRANEKFCEVSQYSDTDLLGANHRIINSEFHSKSFWQTMYDKINAGNIWQGEIRNKRKDGAFYWVNSVIFPVKNERGEVIEFLSILQEITEAKRNESIVKNQVACQNLLMNISNKLINVKPTELSNELNSALKEIGLLVGADRSYIFENGTSSNLYEWCYDGIEPLIENFQNTPFSEFELLVEIHRQGHIVDIPNVSQLESGKFKDLLDAQNTKSILAVPMMDGNKCVGFIGFDSVKDFNTYTDTNKYTLELFANMVVNVTKRVDFIRQVEDANLKFVKINEDLENIVEDKTNKYNELNSLVISHDKLALIGEITAGISHDLNTPIGAIKVGAESIRYTLENLFKSVMEKCTTDQLHYACTRAVENELEMFIGGMQLIREVESMLSHLKKNYPEIAEPAKLARELVKIRIQQNETDAIHKILTSHNPLQFIDLIYHIQSTRTFVDTIMEAGKKSSAVIKNLRLYLKNSQELVKSSVNLNENIKTILNLFSHQLRNKIELEFSVPIDIEIVGYTNNLFQLWSNLIKNALEEMEDGGKLIIEAKETENKISIIVSNTGKKISDETQKRMFDKFYTTKSMKNGTGMGLSIVKKVVQEHMASIDVVSTDQMTSFIVNFTKSSKDV